VTRVRLTLGYRGTRFAGWAVQPPSLRHGLPTLQGTLQDGLASALGEHVVLRSAGRTDAGVHADAQVVTFDTASGMPAAALKETLPRWLPDDVWVIDAGFVDPTFDARRSALRRWYRYAVWRGLSSPPAAWQGRCLVHPGLLDVDGMRAAARVLLGRRDFATFRTAATDARGSKRTVYAADWLEIDDAVLIFEICADAYLKQMVRAIVGTLLWVGQGRWTPAQFADAVQAADRRAGGPTAPALGLSLHHIDYPEHS
jgi:tRNA pseudouridine38-40 synthase